MQNLLHKYINLSLFVCSAVCAALAMDYPHPLWILLCFFLIPILHYTESGSTTTPQKKELLRAFLYMFAFGFIFSILSTLWFISTYPLDWIKVHDPLLSILVIGGIWTCLGVAMSIPMATWIMITFWTRQMPALLAAFVGASSWTILEYARSWLVAVAIYGPETLFGPHHTYYSLAYPLSYAPFLKELLPVGGMYLASFVIILVNYCAYYIFRSVLQQTATRSAPLVLGTVIFSLLFTSTLGMKYIRATTHDSDSSFTASIITTNLPSGTTKDVKNHVAFDAVSSIRNKEDLIVLPENVSVLSLYAQKKDLEHSPLYSDSLVMGSFADERFSNIFYLNPKSGRIAYSGKRLLMPIGEYNVTWITFLLKKFQSASWFKEYEASLHTANKNASSFVFNDISQPTIRIAGTLCSENISPYLYRDATNRGATVLVNLASHAPFRGSPLLWRQTMIISATRALENGRYYVAASNSTKSFVISDEGIVKKTSDSKETYSHFDTRIYTKEYLTPYVLYGDYIVLICIMLLTLLYIWREQIPHFPRRELSKK